MKHLLPLIIITCLATYSFGQDQKPLGDGGPATNAFLNYPYSAVIDNSGNLYISDTRNHRIRKVDASGKITTVVGNGKEGFTGDGGAAADASLSYPATIAFDNNGNLFIADAGNNRIRKVDASGKITTVAGSNTKIGYSGDGGKATLAKLYNPDAIAFDEKNNLYFTDTGNNRVRKVDAATGIITTVVGTGVKGQSGDNGLATAAKINTSGSPVLSGLTIVKGNMYLSGVSDRVRKIVLSTGIITTILGTDLPGFSGDGGPATKAQISAPGGIALDAAGNIYVVDQQNYRIRKIDGATGIITTISTDLKFPQGLTIDSKNNLYVATDSQVRKIDLNKGTIMTVAGKAD